MIIEMGTHIPEEAFLSKDAINLFMPRIAEILKNSIYSQDISEEVFQPCNKRNQEIVMSIISELLYENSTIVNSEHLHILAGYVAEGKSCLLLPEHYSNFDYPGLFYLSQKDPLLKESFEKLICMAASKLNTESKVVLGFSEAFNRIMIYPARLKQQNEGQDIEEQKKLSIINQRALRVMLEYKQQGHMILMFPSGTRYRPGNPNTQKALTQVASFIKRFDYFCFIGISGNLLAVSPNNKMECDLICRDTMVYYIDEPQRGKDFLKSIENKMGKTADLKEQVSEEVTRTLKELHQRAEDIRRNIAKETPPCYLGPMASTI